METLEKHHLCCNGNNKINIDATEQNQEWAVQNNMETVFVVDRRKSNKAAHNAAHSDHS